MKFEAEIIRALQSGLGDGFITFFKVITLFGSWLGFAATLAIIFCRKRSLSYAFAVTFLFGTVFNFAIKFIFRRARPFDAYKFILNIGKEGGYSMPSSHATLITIIVVFLIYLTIKSLLSRTNKALIITGLTILDLLVCLSRMVLGAHYLTDLFAGIFEGVILGVVGIVLHNLIMKKLEGRKKDESSSFVDKDE